MVEKILVVEDEENIRELCQTILTQEGYSVAVVNTAQEALVKLKGQTFDLLLTDIQIPGKDGLTLLSDVHEIQSEIASIIITEHGAVKNALQALHLGAQGILLKPFTSQELSQCIADALEKNRLARENIRLKLLLPLFEISHGFLYQENLQGLLETVSTVIQRELKADTIAIFLHDDKRKELTLRYGNGLPEEKEHLLDMAQWVSEQEEPLILVDHTPMNPFFQQIITHYRLSSAMSLPIRGKQGITGVLILLRRTERNTLTQTDIEFVTILSNQVAIAMDNIKLFDELEKAHFEAIKALAGALEVKDAYTRGHSDRTVEHATELADRLGLSSIEKEHLKYAAILHDIGKIGISELILNKPGRLTEEEFGIMKKHPELGAHIVKHIKFLAPVAPLIYHHQERYDGKGYPEGLSGEAIPIGSRIIAVLDAYDAMTSDRIYRKSPGKARAIAELKKFAGTQFDPQVVKAFLTLIGEQEEGTPPNHSHSVENSKMSP